MLARDAHDDAAEHRHEAAVTVLGEAVVTGLGGQAFDGLGRQADVQDRVHHAGHGRPRAGADGYQQGPLGVAEAHTHRPFHPLERLQRSVPHARGILLAEFVIFDAGFGRNRESRRHRDAQVRHLGQPRPLAAEQLLHIGGALGFAVTEVVDVFLSHACPLLLPQGDGKVRQFPARLIRGSTYGQGTPYLFIRAASLVGSSTP